MTRSRASRPCPRPSPRSWAHLCPPDLSLFSLDVNIGLTEMHRYPTPNPLPNWYSSRSGSTQGYDLLCKLFEWDPAKRITAREALAHPWFLEEGGVNVK